MHDRQLQQALALHRAGQLPQAEAIYRQILEVSPDHPGALYLLSLIASHQRDYAAALDLTGHALRLNPDFFEAHLTHASALAALERPEDALAALDHALRLNPNHAEAWHDRALILHALQRYQSAIESCDRAIQLNPALAAAHFNRANALHALAQYPAAIESYDRALQLNPAYAEAFYNRGVTLQALDQHQSAIASYNRAIALHPTRAQAYQNRGIAHLALLDYSAALADFGHALALAPGFADAHSNRATALLALEQYQPALESYNAAALLSPSCEWLPGMRLHLKRLLCDWHNLDAESRDLEAAIIRGEKAAPSFVILATSASPAVHRRAAEIYIRARFPTPTPAIPAYPAGPRIRIGYFSADYHDHATSHLMAELFERHDRARFEIFAFSFGPAIDDPMRRRISAAFSEDRFLDVRTLPDRDIAHLARSLSIDIAVDLKGLTQQARPGIFAHRAAPLQVNYLGYPGTMGAPFIDYLIADPTLIPASAQPHYSEKIIYLPGGYQPNPTFAGSHDPGCPIRPGCPVLAPLGRDPFATNPVPGSNLTESETGCPVLAPLGRDPFATKPTHRPNLTESETGCPVLAPLGRDPFATKPTHRPNLTESETGCPVLAPLGRDPSATKPTHRPNLTETETGCPVLAPLGRDPSATKPTHESDLTASGRPTQTASSLEWDPSPTTRAAHHLPSSAFVFCCFNNPYKITPAVFDSWMRILAQVPSSVLWLLESIPQAAANLRREAALRNLAPERLIFAPPLPHADHLARLPLAGLFLDTFPYTAHTTASDALFAGLPLLTRIGETFPSRVAASLLRALNLPELITTTPAAYEQLAVTLARDPARYRALRTRLEQNRATTPLFDCAAFTRHLESAYASIHARHQANLPPAHIHIPNHPSHP